jgi:glutamyl-tRNA reductase
MKVAMVSCDHDNLHALEIFKKHFFASIEQLHDPSHVLLSTCNRIEYYFTHDEVFNQIHHFLARIPTQDLVEIQPHLHFKMGQDCFVHLCKVAAGLDSLILCESEILGQIKTCYEKATSAMTLSADLHFIFQKAMTIGKQVRANFHFFKGLPDIEHSIVQLAKENCSEIEIEDFSVLILGASSINKKIVKHLKHNKGIKSIAVCSHSHEHAEEFAKEHDILLVSWESKHNWEKFNMVICAAKTEKDYLFCKETFSFEWNDKKIVFDLGIPRNIDPVLNHPNLNLVNLEQLDEHVRSQRIIAEHVLVEVEALVKEKTLYHIQNFAKRQEYMAKAEANKAVETNASVA